MYRVKASYKYQAEDVDELNFEVGEIIDVVEYDDSEDQVWFFESTFKLASFLTLLAISSKSDTAQNYI